MISVCWCLLDLQGSLQADVTKVQVELKMMEGGEDVMECKQAIMMEKAIELDKEEMFAMRFACGSLVGIER